MNRSAVVSKLYALVCLAMVPVLWAFATDAIPPVDIIRTEPNGNRMGPWVFTWGLVWVAVAAAIVVAWLCYASARASSGASATRSPQRRS